KLYVANRDGNSVTSIYATDKTLSSTINGMSSPVWAIARVDSQRVYVLNSGDGSLAVIDTSNDSLVPNSVSAGAGANFMFYDKHLNRLYVTNPAPGTLSIVDISADPPQLLTQIDLTAGVNGCPGCIPVSVTALPDGTRAYVAGYVLGTNV